MEVLVMTGQILLALSILVGLHELGHLLAAKLFGMRVEKYSIGFPPKIFGFRMGETEYSLGAIPLGGYVKITGMVDESLDTENLSHEPQPWEFRAKPAWQRLIVMMGGIIVNVVTGIIIFITLTYMYGEQYLPIKEVKHGIVASEIAEKIGLQTGDKIVKINGQSFDKFDDITSTDVLLGSNMVYTVDRDGKTFDVTVPDNLIEQLSDAENARRFIGVRAPFKVGKVSEGSAADKAGIKEGDKIIRIGDQEVRFFDELQNALKESMGKTVAMKVLRDGKEIDLKAAIPEATEESKGVLGIGSELELNYATVDYTFGEAVARGTERAFNVVVDNIKAFGKIFRGEVSFANSVSGPVGIAGLFGGEVIWYRFWSLTGLLSMILAFMNFLPIPALDGGHVMFLMYEIISGRAPSDKFLEVAQKIGMVLLLGLMVFAIGNDIYKKIKPKEKAEKSEVSIHWEP